MGHFGQKSRKYENQECKKEKEYADGSVEQVMGSFS